MAEPSKTPEPPKPFVAFGPPDEFGIPTEIMFEGIHAEPERQANRELFHTELEFVQGLANPFYLWYLARYGYMDDPAFLNYLKYLKYWQEKEYAQFVLYPYSLHILNLLDDSTFRLSLKERNTIDFLQLQMFEHWRTWRAKARPPVLPDEEQPAASGTTLTVGTPQISGLEATTSSGKEGGTPRPQIR
ncbi:suppressor of hpr1 [Tulasnella sp. JGI-2019a]|nr:suppressor of hpr1 [Tulasnella sp. JGI-2019a]